MKNMNLAVLAAEQPARNGIFPLSAASLGAGGRCLPASWRTAASVKRPRPVGRSAAEFALVMTSTDVTMQGHTNIRNQRTNMTRFYADGEGGSGPHPLSKPA